MSDTPQGSGLLDRLRQGKSVKLQAVAEHGGFPVRTLRSAISRGEIQAVRVGKTIVIPPAEAARLLGMGAPAAPAEADMVAA